MFSLYTSKDQVNKFIFYTKLIAVEYFDVHIYLLFESL